MPEVEVTVQMSDPDSGEILDTQTKNVKELAAGESTNIGFDLDTAKMADGINTTLTAEVSLWECLIRQATCPWWQYRIPVQQMMSSRLT